MFIKLEKDDFSRVAPLFSSLSHNLIIAAVIEGTSKGWVYCDHLTKPQSAFMGTMEGYFLAGDSGNRLFNSGAQKKIQTMMEGDTVRPNTEYLEFEFSSEAWLDHLGYIFQEREPLVFSSRYYRCNTLALRDWRALIPRGFSIQPVNEERLQNPQIVLEAGRDSHFHPHEWALGFGSLSNYLTHGFGFVVMDGDIWASWSMSDCVAKSEAEIGIYTMPEYRRRSLGTIAVAAAVDYCVSRGIESIGWHCNDGNTASQRIAEKVGFELIKTLERYYIVRPEWRHYAELGLRDFHNSEFHDCVEKYEAVFRMTNEAENYIYHLAAIAAGKIGNLKKALTWLRKAADRGWANYLYTESRMEFESLRDFPEWETIVVIMKKNEGID
jgi:RimJ/RimL family protein N-acetyltransferase